MKKGMKVLIGVGGTAAVAVPSVVAAVLVTKYKDEADSKKSSGVDQGFFDDLKQKFIDSFNIDDQIAKIQAQPNVSSEDEKRLEALMAEKERLTGQISGLTLAQAQGFSEIERLKDEIAKIKEEARVEVEKVTAEKNALSDAYKAQALQINTLKDNLATIEQEIKDFNTQLAQQASTASDAQLAAIQQQLAAKQKEADAAQKAIQDKQNELQALRDQLSQSGINEDDIEKTQVNEVQNKYPINGWDFMSQMLNNNLNGVKNVDGTVITEEPVRLNDIDLFISKSRTQNINDAYDFNYRDKKENAKSFIEKQLDNTVVSQTFEIPAWASNEFTKAQVMASKNFFSSTMRTLKLQMANLKQANPNARFGVYVETINSDNDSSSLSDRFNSGSYKVKLFELKQMSQEASQTFGQLMSSLQVNEEQFKIFNGFQMTAPQLITGDDITKSMNEPSVGSKQYLEQHLLLSDSMAKNKGYDYLKYNLAQTATEDPIAFKSNVVTTPEHWGALVNTNGEYATNKQFKGTPTEIFNAINAGGYKLTDFEYNQESADASFIKGYWGSMPHETSIVIGSNIKDRLTMDYSPLPSFDDQLLVNKADGTVIEYRPTGQNSSGTQVTSIDNEERRVRAISKVTENDLPSRTFELSINSDTNLLNRNFVSIKPGSTITNLDKLLLRTYMEEDRKTGKQTLVLTSTFFVDGYKGKSQTELQNSEYYTTTQYFDLSSSTHFWDQNLNKWSSDEMKTKLFNDVLGLSSVMSYENLQKLINKFSDSYQLTDEIESVYNTSTGKWTDGANLYERKHVQMEILNNAKYLDEIKKAIALKPEAIKSKLFESLNNSSVVDFDLASFLKSFENATSKHDNVKSANWWEAGGLDIFSDNYLDKIADNASRSGAVADTFLYETNLLLKKLRDFYVQHMITAVI